MGDDDKSEKLDPPLKAKDDKGKDHDVDIDINKKKGTGVVNGKNIRNIKRKKKKKGDKKTVITADHTADMGLFTMEVNVVITIDCEADPPTVTVEVFKAGKSIKKDVYTITHTEQDRVVGWLEKNTDEAPEEKDKDAGSDSSELFLTSEVRFIGPAAAMSGAMPALAQALSSLLGTPGAFESDAQTGATCEVSPLWPPFIASPELEAYQPIGAHLQLGAIVSKSAGGPFANPKKRGPFTFVTVDDDTSDLHITFAGSGGELSNPDATPKPNTANVVKGNQVDILWDPALKAGTTVDVTVDCPFPIEVNSYYWTYLV